MKLYTIYKIDNHFKIYYNFKTKIFDSREARITSDNFNTSKVNSDFICKNINKKESLKEYGTQHYCFIKKIIK